MTLVRMIELAKRSAAPAPAPAKSAPLVTSPPPVVSAPLFAPAPPITQEALVVSGHQPSTILDALVAIVAGAPTLAAAGAFPWRPLEETLLDASATLARSSDLFWIAMRALPGEPMLATHHARVAIMALRLGANLKIDGEALIALGMAGCLFDLGLGALPGAASLAPEALPHDHPLHSAELIRRWEPPYPGIVDAVAQHHEREHGRGYPAGTSGEAIHLHAKILGLLDQYTRLARSGDVRGPHDAVREILRERHDAFPADVIKALLAEVSVFPPGTLVRLNTGERARVLEPNRHQPLRPHVELLEDREAGTGHAPRRLDLTETPFIYIRSAVGDGK